jgi:hypothetical protein
VPELPISTSGVPDEVDFYPTKKHVEQWLFGGTVV